MAKVLIIDADALHVRALIRALREDNHEVHHATTGLAGIADAAALVPDAILVEWALPDMTGVELLSRLTVDLATRLVPVVFVSARGDEIYRVYAFEHGAADYVTKPVSVRELRLRLRAILRRRSASANAILDERHGSLRVDRAGHRIFIEEREVAVTRLEYVLLTSLADASPKVLTREALLRSGWGESASVTERTVDTHLTRLRAKLGVAAGYIQTVRGCGYRFSADEDR